MVHAQTTFEWAYEQYLLYLCLCIADSDCVICEDEFDSIKKLAFPNLDCKRSEQISKSVYMEFIGHDDREKRELIAHYAPKFLRTDFIRNKVICSLEKVANPDPESDEQVMFRYIRKVIHSLPTASRAPQA